MLVYVYGVYLIISVFITVWVGRTLHKNGRIFLVQNFDGNAALADSINHLLLVGFYLINFGFMCMSLKYGDKPADAAAAIEFLSTKIGMIILVLGVMHFFNMHALVHFRSFFGAFVPAKKQAEEVWKA